MTGDTATWVGSIGTVLTLTASMALHWRQQTLHKKQQQLNADILRRLPPDRLSGSGPTL